MIISKTFDVTGQVGDAPRTVRMVVTDNLAAVTAAGFINQQLLFPDYIYPSDFVDIRYGVDINNPGSGTNGIFTVSIVNNIVTLSQFSNNGSVNLPVVNGHIAVFQGTTGTIGDAGLFPSNPANHVIPTLPSATYVVGTWPIFAAADGSLKSAINSNISQTNTTAAAAPTDSLISLFYNLTAATLSVANATGIGGIFIGATANIVNNSNIAGIIASMVTIGNGTGTNEVYGMDARLNIGGGGATVFPGTYAPISGTIDGTLTSADNPNVYLCSLVHGAGNRISSHFNISGNGLNFMRLNSMGTALGTPGGGTPGGALRTLSVSIDGVEYFLLVAASYS
jgi:hypothetical protein